MKSLFSWNIAQVCVAPSRFSVLEQGFLRKGSIGGEVVDLMNSRIDKERMTESEIVNIFADVCEVSAYLSITLAVND
jgi:hypothetical protein